MGLSYVVPRFFPAKSAMQKSASFLTVIYYLQKLLFVVESLEPAILFEKYFVF